MTPSILSKKSIFLYVFILFSSVLLGLPLLVGCVGTSISGGNNPPSDPPSDPPNPPGNSDGSQPSEEEKKIAEVSVQSVYQKESDGAPPRPSWSDNFRHYGDQDFFKRGRYPLVWRKDPGERGTLATRWELYQIIFKDPVAMSNASKWGKAISVDDVESVSVIHANTNLTALTFSSVQDFNLPNDILPAITTGVPDDLISSVSSTYTSPIVIPVNANTQVGYYPILPTNSNNRNAVVAYKVRLYTATTATTAKGEITNVERFNDSVVLMVDYPNVRTIQITGGGSSGGGGSTASDLVPDALTNLTQLRAAIGITAPALFKAEWENRKIVGTAPIEELMTASDFETLFPANVRRLYHDKDLSYYTWANLVEASRYFTNFVNEGTRENRYRELAAFLGNKSHETGDGGPAMGRGRWSYGVVWIIELIALTGSGISQNPANREDLYNAYLPNSYVQADRIDYPPVTGKSYHGRGPVQLSWNYNYGLMSEVLFGDKNILLQNPNLIARHGVLGWASAIWFWMEPQVPKPAAHDVMVGNVDFSEPYTVPTSIATRSARTIVAPSIGRHANGTPIDYTQPVILGEETKNFKAPNGGEIGFGLTINIINGGLESSVKIDNRHARRIGFFARYLDYFGTTKGGRDDGQNLAISPQVKAPAGDPVPAVTVNAFRNWMNWHYLPQEGGNDPNTKFPTNTTIMPSIMSSAQASPLQ